MNHPRDYGEGDELEDDEDDADDGDAWKRGKPKDEALDDNDPHCVNRRKQLERALAILSEHFDSVLIFATQSNVDTTSHYIRGAGNRWASRGLVADWYNKLD